MSSAKTLPVKRFFPFSTKDNVFAPRCLANHGPRVKIHITSGFAAKRKPWQKKCSLKKEHAKKLPIN